MGDLKLGLTRGDFNQHSVETFQALLQDSAFNDVTLVCEDQRQVKGHKVILSSGSKFLKEIFLNNPHPHPLIYLKLTYDHLSSIVRFIYLGQCEVDQSDIDNFLATAQDLLIEGLCSEKEKVKSHLSPQIHMDKSVDPDGRTQQTKMMVLTEFLPEGQFSLLDETAISNDLISYSETATEEVKEEPYVERLRESDETEQATINENYCCPKCGKIEFCEAALIVHKRKDHSIHNIEAEQAEQKKTLTNRTKVDRKRDLNHFQTYVSVQTGTSLNQIINGKNGDDVVLELFFGYFSNFRNQNGEIPSIGYITKLRRSINCELTDEFKLDLSNKELFQNRWQVVISGLYNTDKLHPIVQNREIMQAEHKKILSERTITERKRDLKYFQSYVSAQTGQSLNKIINGKDGIDVVQGLFFGYFSNFRNQNGEIPSFSYISKLRSTINSELITQFKLDLSIKEQFQNKWQRVISVLYNTDKSCQQCKIEFTDSSDLKRHMEIHQSLSSCTVADRNREMNRFEEYVSDPAGRSIGPNEISNKDASVEVSNKGDTANNRKIANNGDIANAIEIPNNKEPSHNEETSHSCKKCEETFTRAWKLRSHLKTHTTEPR